MFEKWCENVTALVSAIETVQRDLRKYISNKEITNRDNYTKLLSYLVICWCEARIMKLIHEPEYEFTNRYGTFTKPKSFNNDEILAVQTAESLKDKWLTAVKIAMSRAYNVPINGNFPNNLPITPRSRYNIIQDLITNKLLPSIELRNRIAHGQWKQAFTNDLGSFSQPLTTKLRTENIVDLQQNYAIFNALSQLIHDLASSTRTFERDFDHNYRLIETNILNLNHRRYPEYCASLVAKSERGKQRMRANKLKLDYLNSFLESEEFQNCLLTNNNLRQRFQQEHH